jgi:sialidase-1
MKKPICALIAICAISISCSPIDIPVVNWPDKGNSSTDNETELPSGPGTGEVAIIKTQVFKQGTDGYNTFRIPVVVRSNEGTLLCFAEGRTNSSDDFGDIDIVMKRSTDNGKTWQKLQVVAEDGINRCCNPTPVVLGNDKIILVYSWNHDSTPDDHIIYTIESDDDGVTWKNKTNILSQISRSGEGRYLPGPCHGIVKEKDPHKGRIIIPHRGKSSKGTPVHVICSDDNGKTWFHGGSVNYAKGNECTVAELSNGSILIDMRNTDDNDYFRWQAISQDGGNTWKDPYRTELVETQSGCQGALHRFKWDEKTGKAILLFSNPTHTSSRRHGAVKLSLDEGLTWPKMYMFTTKSGDDMYCSYSDLVTMSTDVIGVAYEAGKNNGQGILFKTFKYSSITEDYTY